MLFIFILLLSDSKLNLFICLILCFLKKNKLIGLVIEEITEEVQSSLPGNHDISSSEDPTSAPEVARETSSRVPSSNTESIQALRDDPESIRFILYVDVAE